MALAFPFAERHPALQSPDFRRIFFNAFFASASHWTMLLARGWLVFELTDQAVWVGAVTFAGMIPLMIAGPFGGALADRADRRRMAMGADAVGIVSALGLAAIALPGLVEPWHILVFAALGGTARAFGTPAEQALIPNVVPREHLLNAVALAGITRHGSRVLGPLAGAALLTTFGAGSVFLLSGGFLTLALYQMSRLQHRAPPAAGAIEGPLLDARRILRDVGEGFSYLERDPRVAVVLVLVGLHCGLTMAFDSMMPTLASSVGGADRTFGGIIVGIGVGAIAGTLTVAMLRDEQAQGRALLVAGMSSGLAMLVIGFATTPAMAIFGGMLAGATQSSFMALTATFVQRTVPDELRGRVMSIYVMLAAGHMAFVNFGFGWLADGIGVRVLLIVPGLIWTAAFVGAVLLLPEVRSLVQRGDFRPRPTPVLAETEVV
jgi:MFS family permease